jgi:hypothetical protein
MKRHLITILIFLLAGAAVNVAVAWGCVIHSDSRPYADIPAPKVERAGLGASDSAWLEALGWVSRFKSDIYRPHHVTTSEFTAFGLTRRAFFEQPDTHGRGGSFTEGRYAFAYRTIAGWPFRCLDAATQVPEPGFPNPHRYSHGFAVSVTVDYGFGPIDKEKRPIPFSPLWPGFAVNTLSYALILWLLILGPFAVRRSIRRRRGLCPQCAYPMGEAAVCTECGKPLPSRPRPAT